MPPSTKYPIIISYSAISSISALSKEANAVHENRMSDELSENRMSELSSDLQKILEEALDTDTVLSVDGEDIKAHRVLLQARSPVFRKMFQHDSMEASNSTIVIPDIGSATMKRLVKFLYTGMMEKCDFDETLELYYAADKYEVLSLREDCRRELPKNLDVNNACSLFILANRHNDEEVKEKVVKFVSDNYTSVVNTESFMEMSKEDMGSLVRLCAAGKE